MTNNADKSNSNYNQGKRAVAPNNCFNNDWTFHALINNCLCLLDNIIFWSLWSLGYFRLYL